MSGMLRIDPDELIMEDSELLQALGYPPEHVPFEMKGLIDQIKEELPGHCRIKAGYVLHSIDAGEDFSRGLTLDRVFLHTRSRISRQLKGAEKAVIFVCTLGHGPGEWVQQLQRQGEPALSFIADSAASLMTELLAQRVHDKIAADMTEKGWKVSNRFSPGYCGWNVEEQQKLFSLLPPGFCGISLGDSAFMEPRKSVSGLIGTGKHTVYADYSCKQCSESQCIYRLSQIKKGVLNDR